MRDTETHQEDMTIETLLTISDAARVVSCHEETIRRAYQAGQLAVVRLGSRNVRIEPAALREWIKRGMPTRRFATGVQR